MHRRFQRAPSTGVSDGVLSLICSPGDRLQLTPVDDTLETIGVLPVKRFRVVEGIPVLIEGDKIANGRQEQGIVQAFKARSSSYYDDNYGVPSGSERLARYELVIELLRSFGRPGQRVADVGSGPAVFAEPARAADMAYVAVDLSLNNLLAARKRVPVLEAVVGNVTQLPLRDAAADLVVCIGCLEYVPAQAAALSELLRVTRRGGYVIVSHANARSPRRRWEELAVHPAGRIRRRLGGQSEQIYRRRLATVETTTRAFMESGARVEHVEHIGQGLIGYPLSNWRPGRELASTLQARLAPLRRLSAEFLLVARRNV